MAQKDKVYKCLNPVGIQDPVDLYPLAPRLDTLDGKNIMFNMAPGSEQDLLIPLPKKLQSAYPKVNWNMRSTGGTISDEEMRTADALIQGVAF